MVLALLALGEQAPAAFPVHVSIEARGVALRIGVDGQMHVLSSALGGGWTRLLLDEPGPIEREYQIDGSDTTATDDRDAAFITGLRGTPLYTFDAWLRDEESYSRWEHLSVVDLDSGAAVPPDAALPADFRVEADLRRPEAPARLWLLASGDRREGLELDRDRRNARWLIKRAGGLDALPRWFFPEEPMPFVAELLQLVGRSAAAAFALAATAFGLSTLTRRSNLWGARGVTTGWVSSGLLAAWLAAAGYVAVVAYQQLPHILDAVSYTFQAGVFASGALAQAAPPVPDAFKGPFEVLWQSRIFSQYPPGAAVAYALGRLVGLEWLIGPLACASLIATAAWSAAALHGRGVGVTALALGVISPFVLFQAGSYLSHPIAGWFVAGALAAFVAGELRGSSKWFAICGALLGAAFLAREVAGVLFALPLGARLIARRRWAPMTQVIAFGAPFVLMYLLYNLRQTGDPILLPRSLFNASDHFGFGDGIGFHTRHTLAAGLANTDELLTILQFDVLGWPPLFAFGLMCVPFLFGRAGSWDWLALGGFLAFVVAYVGYFYHGIALGPRYYFEAVPWLLLLSARGVAVLAELGGGYVAPGVLVAALSLNTLLFYVPAEMARRMDMSGLPGAIKLKVGFVEQTPFGPQLNGVPANSLVLSDDWWIYNTTLAPLNCPRLPECSVLFALATTADDAQRLHGAYPGRTLLRVTDDRGVLAVVPY